MLKVSDAPVSFCFLPCIFRLAFLHPLEKNTFNTDIGDLKSKRCRLAGQVTSAKTPGDPEKALGLTCERSQSCRQIRIVTGHK